MIVPTTTVSVLRGDETNPAEDEWGDTVDTDTVVKSGLPASVVPVNTTYFDPASGQTLTRQLWSISLRPRAFAFTSTDRVRDEATGQVYQVEDVTTSPARLMQQVIHLRCSQVG